MDQDTECDMSIQYSLQAEDDKGTKIKAGRFHEAESKQTPQDLRNSPTDTRNISRRILRPEDGPPTNPAHTPKSHKQRAAKASLPLAANIIRLVCQRYRNIGIRTGCNEENPKIAHSAGGREPHQRQANKGNERVDDQDRSTEVVTISEVGGQIDDYYRKTELCTQSVSECGRAPVRISPVLVQKAAFVRKRRCCY
ncbi:MAG: hypothetical protein Q9191_006197, partial [Dirinaria sp. TL-2023a]